MAKETAKKSTTKAKEASVEKPTKKKPVEEKPAKKSKKGLVAGIIAAVAVLIIGVVVAVLCLNKTDASDPRAQLTYSNAFFIYDNEKYTIWNAEGKRVVEDEFDNQSNFVAGYAYVKKDNQAGIIRDDGKMSVEFGKYGSITARGGLYLAQDGNTKEYHLLTGSGKDLEHSDRTEVYAPSGSSGFAVVRIEGKVKIYTYAGQLIAETDAVEGVEPGYTGSHDFGLVYYDNHNWAFDARDGQVLAEFDGAQYKFDTVSDDRTTILIKNSEETGKYKLLKDGRVYDLEETKYYAVADLNIVLGYDNYSEIALLDNDYKVVKRVADYLELKDYNNYAVETEGGVEIYYNGEKVKNLGEESNVAASGVLYEDFYAVEAGDKAMFYKLDGSVGINHEYRDIRTLFDKHHHAVVSDTEGEYYLIDATGKQISEVTFKTATARDGGYELKNNDGKYAIANKDGKPMTEFKYDTVYYRSNAEPHNIWTGRNAADSYDVINLEKGEVIAEGVNVDSFYTNYFTVKGDHKIKYYTYSGEMFYEAEQ